MKLSYIIEVKDLHEGIDRGIKIHKFLNNNGGTMTRGGNVTAYLNAEEMEALEAQEQKEGAPKNQIIKRALRLYLKREEKRA